MNTDRIYDDIAVPIEYVLDQAKKTAANVLRDDKYNGRPKSMELQFIRECQAKGLQVSIPKVFVKIYYR